MIRIAIHLIVELSTNDITLKFSCGSFCTRIVFVWENMVHTYSQYRSADYVPPVVLFSIVNLLGLLSVNGFMFYMIYMQKVSARKSRGTLFNVCCRVCFIQKCDWITINWLRGKLTKIKHFTCSWTGKYSFLLSSLWYQVLFPALFWEVFLLEESFICDPDLDCFPFDADNNTNLQDNPVLNCTDFGMSDHHLMSLCIQPHWCSWGGWRVAVNNRICFYGVEKCANLVLRS